MVDEIDLTNEQFKNVLDLVQFTNQSVFLTGKAGTGKSTLLRHICNTTKKKHVVLAPTGIAAINAGGCTLHSFFHLPFHPLVPDDNRFSSPSRLKQFLKYSKEHIKLLRETDLIIIDEISMVRSDIIDFIDKILRTYCGNFRQPFAGKQMLFVGDVFQLEPVVSRDEGDILRLWYENPYFFSARVFKEIHLVSIELNKVYRQNDTAFISVLDRIRNSTATKQQLDLINTCVIENEDVKKPSEDDSKISITLAARRDVVDNINRTNLNAIAGDPMHFVGKIKGDFPETSLPTLLDLELKVGAQIIFVKNDPDHRFVNGTLGTIVGVDMAEDKYLEVVTDDGVLVDVERARWANVRYSYNEKEKKIEETELGVFTQFPLRLAWAITIHKSQGLTFNNVTIDFSGGVFAGGQTYVALSRCRSLDGLQLTKEIQMSDIFVNPNVVQFSKQYNDQRAVDSALKRASADIEYHDAVVAFDNNDFNSCLVHFFKAIHARYDIERPWAWRYIRRKLSKILLLTQEVESLRATLTEKNKQIQEMQQTLNDYADEYLHLARECQKEGMHKAALSNLDKAIRMNPRLVDAYVEKSQILLSKGKLLDALTCVNLGLDIVPTHFKSIYTRGKIHFRMQNFDQAINDLNRCTSLKKNNISAHQLLGDVYSAMDDEESAALQYAIVEQLKKKKSKE